MNTKILEPAAGAYQYPLLIKSLLLSGQRYEPNNEIVYGDKVRYDYKTLNERIQRLANALTDAGVQPGDTVAVLDWDSNRYLECFFAIPMIGAVLHTVNVRLSPEQIIYTMNHAEDSLVLVHDDFIPLLEQVHSKLTTVTGYIQLTDGTASSAELPIIDEYEALLAAAAPSFDFPDFDENSVATTFYTTGTTGDPKGVYFTHRQLVLHTLNEVATLGVYQGLPLLRSNDVYMPITPMFHVHAWGVPYAATMMGIKQVYPGRYEPNTLVRLFQREKVTFSHCVPTILQMLLSCDEGKDADLFGWKMLLGGSALTQSLAQDASQRGIEVFSGYGMSETCPVLTTTYLRPDELSLPMSEQVPLRLKTGVPVGLVDLQIVDSSGAVLPHDGEAMGEIVVRAPWLTQGYFKEEVKGAELWADGWLHTGDVATVEPNGVVQIKDRIKDVIKTGGEWISSLELENLISQHDSIADVSVIGIPDSQWGERPYALIVLKDTAPEDTAPKDTSASLDLQMIKEHLQQFVDEGRINKWAIPGGVEVVEDIPKTSVGKIDKKSIRSRISAAV